MAGGEILDAREEFDVPKGDAQPRPDARRDTIVADIIHSSPAKSHECRAAMTCSLVSHARECSWSITTPAWRSPRSRSALPER